MSDESFQTLKPYRTAANNILGLSRNHCYPIHMNIEINATNLLAFKKVKQVSFNAILTKMIATVFTENPDFAPLNSVLKRTLFSDRLFMSKNMSFSLAQDKDDHGEKVASVYILEDANLKSLEQIHDELAKTHELTLEELPIYKKLKFVLLLPNIVQKILLFMVSKLPTKNTTTYGTVGLTNLGKGQINLVTPVTPKTIMFGVGGLREQLVLREEKVYSEKCFTLNMMFNHYVVDGKICSDFLSAIKEKLETL